jgi:ankyrin repeat protein
LALVVGLGVLALQPWPTSRAWAASENPNLHAGFDAAERGQVDALFAELKAKCVDVDHRWGKHTLLIHAATRKGPGFPLVIERLVAAGANLEATNPNGWTALTYAIFYGHEEAVRTLTRLGAKVNTRDPAGLTPLMVAVVYQRAPIARLLLKAGADARLKSPAGDTAARLATLFGDPALAGELERAARRTPLPTVRPRRSAKQPWPGCRNMPRPRPGPAGKPAEEPWRVELRDPARYGVDREIVEALLSCNRRALYAVLDRRCGHVDTLTRTIHPLTVLAGRLPFTRACHDLLVELVKDGADFRRRAGDTTPLMQLAERNAWETVHALLRAGADPNQEHRDKSTALFWAAQANATAAVRELLAAGASPAHQDRKGLTAADDAERADHLSLATMLRIAAKRPARPRLPGRTRATRALPAECQKRLQAEAEAEARRRAAAQEQERRRETAERLARAGAEAAEQARRREQARAKDAPARGSQPDLDPEFVRRRREEEARLKGLEAKEQERKRAEKQACADLKVSLANVRVTTHVRRTGGYESSSYDLQVNVENPSDITLRIDLGYREEGGCGSGKKDGVVVPSRRGLRWYQVGGVSCQNPYEKAFRFSVESCRRD